MRSLDHHVEPASRCAQDTSIPVQPPDKRRVTRRQAPQAAPQAITRCVGQLTQQLVLRNSRRYQPHRPQEPISRIMASELAREVVHEFGRDRAAMLTKLAGGSRYPGKRAVEVSTPRQRRGGCLVTEDLLLVSIVDSGQQQ